jgi:acetolactate synthase-1/2/3 large subunit
MGSQAETGTCGASNDSTRFSVADLLVAYLGELGVEYVFGIPGAAIEPLYDALARTARNGGVRPIVARHESGAAFMADGYHRHSGRLGVCCATTGPGTTNLVTGVASAYQNNIPMLVVTAQTPLGTFGKGAFQESSDAAVDSVALLKHVTRYSSLISHVEQFERKSAAAIMTALQAPAGPAHLSIPVDILRSSSPVCAPSFQLQVLTQHPAVMDFEAADVLCKIIADSNRVALIIGDDCGEAIGEILQLALFTEAIILTTPHGKGLVNPYHPNYRGVIGFAGHRSAKDALADPLVDTVLAIGTALGEWESAGWDEATVLSQRLIHIASAEDNFTRSPMARLHVRGRFKKIFEYVLKEVQAMPKFCTEGAPGVPRKPRPVIDVYADGGPPRYFVLDEEDKYLSDDVPIKPQRLMHDLITKFPLNTKYLADVGTSFAWAVHYLHPLDRRIAGYRKAKAAVFQATLEFASMGWAIGSSVGVALARPGDPVVCITGDGAMLMTGQEITVALQEGLPVVYVVLNDAALGMVKHGQRLTGAEPVGFELPTVDFAAMARAMGVVGHTIRSPMDLHTLDVEGICARKGPTLLDVYIDSEEIAPIGLRTRSLANPA